MNTGGNTGSPSGRPASLSYLQPPEIWMDELNECMNKWKNVGGGLFCWPPTTWNMNEWMAGAGAGDNTAPFGT